MSNTIDINEIKALNKENKKNITLSVRINNKQFNYLKSNRISATKLFNKVLDQLIQNANK